MNPNIRVIAAVVDAIEGEIEIVAEISEKSPSIMSPDRSIIVSKFFSDFDLFRDEIEEFKKGGQDDAK